MMMPMSTQLPSSTAEAGVGVTYSAALPELAALGLPFLRWILITGGLIALLNAFTDLTISLPASL